MDVTQDAAEQLATMAADVTRLQAIAEAWPLEQRAVFNQLKDGIEALHREALVRLIKGLREDAAAAAQLKTVVRDPFVFAVLRLHGIVRDPLQQRVQAALDAVAPMLAEHGGGVELVAVKPPDTVEVRLTGSCQSCPSSGQTLSEGVERSIREHAPEILHVVQVRRPAETHTHAPGAAIPMHFVSPFAAAGDAGFVDVCDVVDIPAGQVLARSVKERAVLLYADDKGVSCVDNACAHLGLPLTDGTVADGVIECMHHGFRFRLDTGECLDVPEVQLVLHAVRVRNGRVAVKLEA